jgi:hypothetical protein
MPVRPTRGRVDGEKHLRRREGDPGVAERLRRPEIADGLHGSAGEFFVAHCTIAMSTKSNAPMRASATSVIASDA